MASISYVAIILILTFITPAIPIWLIFRSVIPKTRTIEFTDSLIVLACCFVTLLFNGHHILSYAFLLNKKLISLGHFSGPIADYLNLALVQPKQEYWWCLTLQFFYQWLFNWHPFDLNLWEFIVDLHARSTIFGSLACGFFIFLNHVEKSAQLVPYKKNYPTEISFLDKIYLFLCGVRGKGFPTLYENEKKKIQLKPLRWLKEIIFHPWAILTEWNPKREILMIDVVTLDDCLFSGVLSTWVPGKNDVAAVALQYSLKFYKEDEEKKQKLIPNVGELIIASSQIKSVHFWEIRNGTKLNIVVQKAKDCERWKWNLLLMHLYPEFIEKVMVVVIIGPNLNTETAKKLKADIKEWMGQMGIKFPEGKHTVVF